MNDQSNLPSWLPLQEAAQYLEAKLGLTVDAVAILEVARTGHLQLSVFLPHPVMARRVKPGSLSPSISTEPSGQTNTTTDETRRSSADPERGRERPSPDQEHRESVDGVWDLMLEGSGGVEIERRYRLLAGLETQPLPRLDGALVVREQGEVYQLPVDPGMAGLLSPSALPKGSVLGVKPSVLDDFATAIQENWIYQTVFRAHSQPVTEPRPFGIREEKTYLVIMAALMKVAGIKASDPETAGKIEKTTQRMGTSVTAKTIREKLKRAEQAVKGQA